MSNGTARDACVDAPRSYSSENALIVEDGGESNPESWSLYRNGPLRFCVAGFELAREFEAFRLLGWEGLFGGCGSSVAPLRGIGALADGGIVVRLFALVFSGPVSCTVCGSPGCSVNCMRVLREPDVRDDVDATGASVPSIVEDMPVVDEGEE